MKTLAMQRDAMISGVKLSRSVLHSSFKRPRSPGDRDIDDMLKEYFSRLAKRVEGGGAGASACEQPDSSKQLSPMLLGCALALPFHSAQGAQPHTDRDRLGRRVLGRVLGRGHVL